MVAIFMLSSIAATAQGTSAEPKPIPTYTPPPRLSQVPRTPQPESVEDFSDVPSRPTEFDSQYREEHEEKSISLYRIANIDHEPDGNLYQPFTEQLGKADPDIRIHVNGEGKVIHCARENRFLSEHALDTICGDLKNNAEVNIHRGNDLGGWPGVMNVGIRNRPFADYEAAMPVEFDKIAGHNLNTGASDRAAGLINLTIRKDRRTGRSTCTSYTPYGAPRLTPRSHVAVCDAYLAANDETREKCREDDRSALRSKPLLCKVRTRAVEVKNPPEIVFSNLPLTRPKPFLYPPIYREELPLLPLEAGGLRARLDYPSRAVRAGAQGVTFALVGVDRSGRARTCRVFRSAMNEYLDRATCRGILRSGRLNFPPEFEQFEGLRYKLQSVRWLLPN